ncbi:sterol desaturase/sphingolipid hydroxylase (fatty acid hydroxylase superfamily) [Pedobacter sp. UYP24]
MVFLVVLIASFLLQMVLPWWIVVVISFATCGLIGKTGKIALWSPFFAILLLWTGMALYKSLPNENVLAGRVAEMLGVNIWWIVLALTSILGAFVAGVSGFCGYHFRKAVLIKKSTS